MSKLYDSDTWEAYINSFKRFQWCTASFMNTKLFREWIFIFKSVDFWHFFIFCQIRNYKENLGSFLEQGWGQGGGKETVLSPVLENPVVDSWDI